MSIESDVKHDLNFDPDTPKNGVHPNHARTEAGYEEMPQNGRIPGANGYMTVILDAQQQLISAQYQFLHDNNMSSLLRAQLNVIQAQTSVLDRLGVFGP